MMKIKIVKRIGTIIRTKVVRFKVLSTVLRRKYLPVEEGILSHMASIFKIKVVYTSNILFPIQFYF